MCDMGFSWVWHSQPTRLVAATPHSKDAEGKEITKRGKWIGTWRKKADGTWKLVEEIWNSDGSAPSE